MALSEAAQNKLKGLWGSYDFWLIRDHHFGSASDMADRFLEKYEAHWSKSQRSTDRELATRPKQVRNLVTEWAERKLERMAEEQSIATLQTNIMFKQLHFGRSDTINFGSIRANWKKKTEIAEELERYKPWSVAHAAAAFGGKNEMLRHMRTLIPSSASAQRKFFDGWWDLANDLDCPMLFPQVHGHTTGKLWLKVSEDKSIPLHFDFGLVNVMNKTKVLIECNGEIDLEDGREAVAEEGGWWLYRFTSRQITNKLVECFEEIEDDLRY
jgi:hypothetical protein